MVPTIEWMNKYFNLFNKKYFGNKLRKPKLIIGCPNGYWGYLEYNLEYNRVTRSITNVTGIPKLMLTDKYDRDEKDVANTMLHEMVHLYIYSILKKYPFQQHGTIFQTIASKLNSEGWNITEENEIKPTDKPINKKTNNKLDNNKKSIELLIKTIEKMLLNNHFKLRTTINNANKFKNDLEKEKLQINENYINEIIKNSINEVINKRKSRY